MANVTGPYRLRIYRDGRLYVRGWLPETFSFNLTSQWDSPFANLLANKLGALGQAGNYLGMAPRAQFLTIQSWQGSSPVQFNIPMHLWAAQDSEKDVSEIVKKLGALVLPSKAGGMFIPPASIGASAMRAAANAVGGIVAGAAQAAAAAGQGAVEGADAAEIADNAFENEASYRGFITLQIGEFLEIPDLICLSVVPQFFSRMDVKNRIPIEATVDLTFETLYTPAVEDFLEWFKLNKGRGGIATVTDMIIPDRPPESTLPGPDQPISP